MTTPTPQAEAIDFVEALVEQHWNIFTRLLRATKASGNLVPDAYHAAVAIEHGCEWVTADGDFNRFPGLRVAHPLRLA